MDASVSSEQAAGAPAATDPAAEPTAAERISQLEAREYALEQREQALEDREAAAAAPPADVEPPAPTTVTVDTPQGPATVPTAEGSGPPQPVPPGTAEGTGAIAPAPAAEASAGEPAPDEPPKSILELLAEQEQAAGSAESPHGFVEGLRVVAAELVADGRIVETDLLTGAEAGQVQATLVKLIGELVGKAS